MCAECRRRLLAAAADSTEICTVLLPQQLIKPALVEVYAGMKRLVIEPFRE